MAWPAETTSEEESSKNEQEVEALSILSRDQHIVQTGTIVDSRTVTGKWKTRH